MATRPKQGGKGCHGESPRPSGASHICDAAPVPSHRLGFQGRLLHPLTKGLELVLGIQDEEAGVLGGPLEEGYVWTQPPARGKRRGLLLSERV